VLDFGCGNGYAVKRMREQGKEWYGLEYSETAFAKYLHGPPFYVGRADQFAGGQFDMVYSTEVLEHVPEELTDEVIAGICRVASKYLFLTISLRPSSDDNRYHCTLRPRAWWERKFVAQGFQVDRTVVDLYQKVSLKSTRQILAKWAHLGPSCRAFAENPPYELHGETQFWYVAFRRPGLPRLPLPASPHSIYRRRIVPWLRRALGRE
jgi:SAM-dependent methyltransferase